MWRCHVLEYFMFYLKWLNVRLWTQNTSLSMYSLSLLISSFLQPCMQEEANNYLFSKISPYWRATIGRCRWTWPSVSFHGGLSVFFCPVRLQWAGPQWSVFSVLTQMQMFMDEQVNEWMLGSGGCSVGISGWVACTSVSDPESSPGTHFVLFCFNVWILNEEPVKYRSVLLRSC